MESALACFDEQFKFLQQSSALLILLNSQKVQYNKVRELAEQIAPELEEKDALFEWIVQLNQKSTEEKSQLIFKNNYGLPCILRLVGTILAVRISYTFAEQVFSLCNVQWTQEQSSLYVAIVKALIQYKVNLDNMPCTKMYEFLLKMTIC